MKTDYALSATRRDLNSVLCDYLGDGDWFMIAYRASRRFVSGAAIVDLATDVITKMLFEFKNSPEGILQRLKDCPANQRNKLFCRMAWFRAGNISKEQRSRIVSEVNPEFVDEIQDHRVGSELEATEIRDKIMSVVSRVPGKKGRYLQQVASIRLANIGERIGINEIAEQMGVNKGGRLLKALREIGQIYERVAS